MKGTIKSKFLGSLIGSALGDAIGELAFKFPSKYELCLNIQHMNKLRYTDDTAMAIGLAESIIKKNGIDQQHLGDIFRENFQREPWRGYAAGPPKIFSLVQRLSISYTEAARTLFQGKGSLGNGAAMRIAPVGLFCYNNPDLYENASLSAEVTHAHPIAKDGAAILAKAVASAVKLDPVKDFNQSAFIGELIDSAKTVKLMEKMILVGELLSNNTAPSIAADRLGRSVKMDESMPFAVYSFIKNAHSFEECLFCAILNGGDRDTLGAMACAISGAYLGIEAIPESLQTRLENRDYIENLASALANITVSIA